MKSSVMKVIVLLSFVGIHQAQANSGPHTIHFESDRYVATLGDLAVVVESEILEQAKTLCGGVGNILRFSKIRLELQQLAGDGYIDFAKDGKPGATLHNGGIFNIAYPELSGTVDVYCKK